MKGRQRTPDHEDEFEDDAADESAEFCWEDGEHIGIEELKRLNLPDMPEDIRVCVMDSYFPETTVWCEGEVLICEIQEHLYTKYWEHKFSAYAFAEAMEQAVRRLAHEGHPLANPSRDDDDVHIFVRWQLLLSRITEPKLVVESIKTAFDLVWHRADSILDRHWVGAPNQSMHRIADKAGSR